MKLKQLFQGYLENCKSVNLSSGTILQHEGRIRRFIEPILGDLELDQLLPVHGDLVLERGSVISLETGRRCVITLRRALAYAKRKGLKMNVDIDDIEVPPYRRQKDTQALNIKEIQIVREYFLRPRAFSNHACIQAREKYSHAVLRTRALFELLLHTGFRLSEALSIDRRDIDFENHEIRFVSLKTKKWETVYLFGAEQELKDYLATRNDNNPALFVSYSGKRLGVDTAQTYLKILKNRVHLKKNLTHHLFRSTFVTTLLRNKVDPRRTQLLARHSSLQTTLLYYYEVEREELKSTHERVMSLI